MVINLFVGVVWTPGTPKAKYLKFMGDHTKVTHEVVDVHASGETRSYFSYNIGDAKVKTHSEIH